MTKCDFIQHLEGRTDIQTTHQSKKGHDGQIDCKQFVLTVRIAVGTGRRGVTEFFDEPLRGFVCERAAVQSAEFVLIQHMVKIARGILGVSQVYEKKYIVSSIDIYIENIRLLLCMH